MTKKAEIGRFDGELKTVAFNEGDTVQALLNKVNLTLGSGERLNDDEGSDISLSDIAQDGQTYLIVGNYKQGSY